MGDQWWVLINETSFPNDNSPFMTSIDNCSGLWMISSPSSLSHTWNPLSSMVDVDRMGISWADSKKCWRRPHQSPRDIQHLRWDDQPQWGYLTMGMKPEWWRIMINVDICYTYIANINCDGNINSTEEVFTIKINKAVGVWSGMIPICIT